MKNAGGGLGMASGMISSVAGMVPGTESKKAQIAAKTLFTAASAANAIPVAGQFVSAGLAIAGLFVKMFGGKKKAAAAKKKKEAKARLSEQVQGMKRNPGAEGAVTGGAMAQKPIGTTAPVDPAQQASFTGWNGAKEPGVHQQALNSSIGLS